MPISNYDGDTFVAFLDISGFKELMKTEEKALQALNRLYASGYDILPRRDTLPKVEGMFFSDSGLLFVRNGQNSQPLNEIKALLNVIKRINIAMKDEGDGFMTTSSIAFGKFKYQERIEFPGIGKNHNGGNCAAGVFRELARRSLEYLGIPPDDPFGYPYGDPRRDIGKAEWMGETKRLHELYDQWNKSPQK